MPTLNTAANVGLILFLFLVGLEVDLRLLFKNWQIALGVGAAGMAVPFGLGCGIAYGLYHEFREEEGIEPISFGTYMLFIGVAMAITAFPVLCRILTELNLLQTQVGVVVLSAGVGNDIVGWILLALCVALVNSGSGITALYIFLVAIGYILLLVFAVRPVFLWILRRTKSLQNGPSQSIVGLTILMVFASAFFTQIIGIHAIFGAFLVGIICPHEGGFAIKLTEKIEDLVAVFFLPLYFALSGLSTNIGLLDNGITWAYVVGVIAIAFVGKLVGGTLAARACKLLWRESFTIGTLMSCKGLVELIVLNIGLQAKILSQRTFTIFVVMALITTFATTPLVSVLFPPWYQKKLAAWKRGEIDWDGNDLNPTRDSSIDQVAPAIEKHRELRKLLVCLRLDSLPSLFKFVSLFSGTENMPAEVKIHPYKRSKEVSNSQNDGSVTQDNLVRRPLAIHGLRVLELTERLSSVMKESEVDEWSRKDPIVNAFYTFGQLHNVSVSGEVSMVPNDQYANVLNDRAHDRASDMILLPWIESGKRSESDAVAYTEAVQGACDDESYRQTVLEVLSQTTYTTAVLVSNGFGSLSYEERPGLHRLTTNYSIRSAIEQVTTPTDRSHHIFFPFTGGVDDHVALRFVLRLLTSTNVTATILLVNGSGGQADDVAEDIKGKNDSTIATAPVLEARPEADRAFFYAMRDSIATDARDRVVFDTLDTSNPLTEIPNRAACEVGLSSRNTGDMVVVGRHFGRRTGTAGLRANEPESDVKQALGEWADAMMRARIKASVIVIQAGSRTLQG